MSRVAALATAAGLDPRAAHHRGIPSDRADAMCIAALAGADRDAVLAAGGPDVIQDGYYWRKLVESDADDIRRFVQQARRELTFRERAHAEATAAIERLRTLLTPEPHGGD
jgi:hypothetical protein